MAHIAIQLKLDPATNRLITIPNPVTVHPGDTLDWTCPDGDVVVSFEGQNLFAGAQKFDGKKGHTTGKATVRADVAPSAHFDCKVTFNGTAMANVYGVDTSGGSPPRHH